MSGDQKVLTFRVPVELYESLGYVARGRGCSLSAVIREALEEHVRRVWDDHDFKERLKVRLEADAVILKRLAES